MFVLRKETNQFVLGKINVHSSLFFKNTMVKIVVKIYTDAMHANLAILLKIILYTFSSNKVDCLSKLL